MVTNSSETTLEYFQSISIFVDIYVYLSIIVYQIPEATGLTDPPDMEFHFPGSTARPVSKSGFGYWSIQCDQLRICSGWSHFYS
ncbi:MAG: hypothetical protein DHS20C17_14320 [Cyclobacteriaceae bacterium]|nr:MAG: hypothetical protein DHS20C17_14320 [Cyclobacteriaceae bacterium]